MPYFKILNTDISYPILNSKGIASGSPGLPSPRLLWVAIREKPSTPLKQYQDAGAVAHSGLVLSASTQHLHAQEGPHWQGLHEQLLHRPTVVGFALRALVCFAWRLLFFFIVVVLSLFWFVGVVPFVIEDSTPFN